MKYAYAQVLTGSMGPFNFEFEPGYNHNYQLKRKNGGLLLTLPGGQVIGYIMKTIPKFPRNQTEPAIEIDRQCGGVKHSTTHRLKRSTMKDEIPINFDIKKLAESLFSQGLETPDYFELAQDGDVLSKKYIDNLIKKGEAKQEKLSKFVSGLGKKDNPAESANYTIDNF